MNIELIDKAWYNIEMNIRHIAAQGAEKLFEVTIKAVEPLTDLKPRTPDMIAEFDGQDLAEKAALIIENDAHRSVFARYVMTEYEAERISLEEADYYLTPADERK